MDFSSAYVTVLRLLSELQDSKITVLVKIRPTIKCTDFIRIYLIVFFLDFFLAIFFFGSAFLPVSTTASSELSASV